MKIIITATVSLLLAACGLRSPGDGEKIGQVVKVSKHGIFAKTWEAELIRGGLSGGSGIAGAKPFQFTIESESDAIRIQQFMRDQTEVVLTYRTEGIYSVFRSDSEGDFLVTIEPAKK